MKKRSVLFLLLLVGCSSQNNSSSSNLYDDSFNNDYENLVRFSSRNEEAFSYADLNTYQYDMEGKKCITLEFSYKDKEINNFKVIVLPFSIDKVEEAPSSVVNIGYFGKSFTLTENEDPSEYCFRGFRLSFIIKEIDDLKFSFNGIIDNTEIKENYFISSSSIIDKSIDK